VSAGYLWVTVGGLPDWKLTDWVWPSPQLIVAWNAQIAVPDVK